MSVQLLPTSSFDWAEFLTSWYFIYPQWVGIHSPPAQFCLPATFLILSVRIFHYFSGAVLDRPNRPCVIAWHHCFFQAIWMEMALRICEGLVVEFAISGRVLLFDELVMATFFLLDLSLMQPSPLTSRRQWDQKRQCRSHAHSTNHSMAETNPFPENSSVWIY